MEEIDDMLLFLKNVCLTSDAKMVEGIEVWVENMIEPLDVKKAKYAKAVNRILTSEKSDYSACVYHTVVYKDIPNMVTCSTSDTLARLDLLERTKGWPEEKMEVLWKYFSELSRVAFEYSKKALPRVPSRDEIAKNIKTKKNDASSSGLSMQRAFIVAYSTLTESRNGSSITLTDEQSEAKKKHINEKCGDRDIVEILNKQDEDSITLLKEVFDNIDFDTPLSKTDWDLAKQLFTLSKVERAVPTNIMNQVETFAHKLANDMVSGKRDLSSLGNIESLGEELMSKIDPSDIEKLSDGVDGLLPALQMLKNTLPNI